MDGAGLDSNGLDHCVRNDGETTIQFLADCSVQWSAIPGLGGLEEIGTIIFIFFFNFLSLNSSISYFIIKFPIEL